ncbi:hypothetical protein [Mesorhizobium loti]|uniref:hypothetical protein n=1 Tax=Rhizobium loti TaxID=381 RepID=UPI00047DE7FF|nr:hypothetical protein [Mesorhizobium loti]
MATAVPEGLAGQSIVMLRVGRVQSLSFMLPQSSSRTRYAFAGARARDLYTENIVNRARMVAAMN